MPTIESKAFTLTWVLKSTQTPWSVTTLTDQASCHDMYAHTDFFWKNQQTSDKSLVLVPKDGTAQMSALAQYFAQTKSCQKKSSNTTCWAIGVNTIVRDTWGWFKNKGLVIRNYHQQPLDSDCYRFWLFWGETCWTEPADSSPQKTKIKFRDLPCQTEVDPATTWIIGWHGARTGFFSIIDRWFDGVLSGAPSLNHV